MVYTGPPGVRDLHCQRIELGVIRTVWAFGREEREAIARGATLAVEIHSEPIPPIGMAVGWEQGIGEDAPDAAERIESLNGDRNQRLVDEAAAAAVADLPEQAAVRDVLAWVEPAHRHFAAYALANLIGKVANARD